MASFFARLGVVVVSVVGVIVLMLLLVIYVQRAALERQSLEEPPLYNSGRGGEKFVSPYSPKKP
jgi:hypothetical protein